MNFLQRAKAALQATSKIGWWAMSNQWEGGKHDRFRHRPTARLVSNDSDLDFGEREKLISEARQLCQTFGIPRRILRQYSNYCVGDCRVQFHTSDPDWNQLAEDNWASRSKTIDYYGRHDTRGMAKLAVRSMLRDGDVFFARIKTSLGPQLQSIEADRVTNSRSGSFNFDELDLIGGVRLTKTGVPYAYRVCDRAPKNRGLGMFINPVDQPANSILHIYDPDRFDAVRGVTHFHAGALNHMRDMKEIIAAEKAGVKTAGRIALAISNGQGGAPNIGIDLLGDDIDAKGTAIKTEEIADGIIQYQANGDKIESFQSNRPSEAWRGFMEMLIRDIAIGFDLPFEFVWNMAGLAGPGTRMMSKQAERTFNGTMDILESKFLNPAVAWVTINDMEDGLLPMNPEWYAYKIQRPPYISIDAGRDSVANLAEFDAGVITAEEIAQERGQDASEVRAKREVEAREIFLAAQRLMDEFDCPMTTALEMLGRPNAKQAIASVQAELGESASDQEPLNPPPKKPNGKPAAHMESQIFRFDHTFRMEGQEPQTIRFNPTINVPQQASAQIHVDAPIVRNEIQIPKQRGFKVTRDEKLRMTGMEPIGDNDGA